MKMMMIIIMNSVTIAIKTMMMFSTVACIYRLILFCLILHVNVSNAFHENILPYC